MNAHDYVRGCLPGIFSTAQQMSSPSVAKKALVAWAGLYRLGAPDTALDALVQQNKERILTALEGYRPLEGWAQYGIIPECPGQEEGISNSFELLKKVDDAHLLVWALEKLGGVSVDRTPIDNASLVVRGAPHLFAGAYYWAQAIVEGACHRILESEPLLGDSVGLLYRVVEWVDLHPQK